MCEIRLNGMFCTRSFDLHGLVSLLDRDAEP